MLTLSTGVNVRVAESGPRDGTPVVMLHGWGASLYMYRHALALLPPYGVRAIAVDLPGYGLSDKPQAPGAYSLDSYCAHIDALLDALGLSAAALIGQSLGGNLALRYALRRPERVTKLVLINPTGLVPLGPLTLVGRVPRGLVRALRRHLVPRWLIGFILRHIAYGSPSLVSERDVDEYLAPTQLDGFVDAAQGALAEFDWRPVSTAEADSLAMPSLVILGTKDRLVRHAGAAARRLRESRVYDVEGGHCVHEEHPAEVYQIVGEFVR